MTAYAHNDEPLYGPVGKPVEGKLLVELLRRQSPNVASDRKARASVAYDVYTGNLEPHILRAIGRQQSSETIRKDMQKFVSSVRNDARDVTESVAVVYQNGAIRHLGGDGDESDTETTAQEEALRRLAEEAELDEIGEQVNHLGWLQGPQFVVPLVRDEKLTADVVGPHVYDIVQDEANPLGMPVALAWPVGRRVHEGTEECLVYVLDAVSLRLFRTRGDGFQQSGPAVEHIHGTLPAALMRFTRPLVGDDWYLVDRQRRLTQGTIETGVLLARMGLVRKAQCHKLLTIVGDLSTMAKGQEKADPETAIKANTSGKTPGQKPEIQVHEYETDPEKFIRQILFLVQCMVEPYGGHVQVDSGQPDIYGKVVIPPGRQSEHRKRQIKGVRRFEAQFWSAATSMLVAESHPLALDLQSPADMAKNLRVNFGVLALDLEDPAKATVFEDWRLSKGQTSEVQIKRRELGGGTTEEAWREIERNMEQRAAFNELAARFNLKTNDVNDVQTTPEANGAKGTPAREANRQENAADGENAPAQGESSSAGGQSSSQPT
jgi:hypothetical protein